MTVHGLESKPVVRGKGSTSTVAVIIQSRGHFSHALPGCEAVGVAVEQLWIRQPRLLAEAD